MIKFTSSYFDYLMSVIRYHTYSDTALLDYMASNDEHTFEELYQRYGRLVFGYVYNRMHIKAKAKEVVQEMFTRLWEKRGYINVQTSVKNYLYGTVKHIMLNAMRAEQIRERYADQYTLYIAPTVYDNSNIEYQNLRDIHSTIEESISALPENCQSVFRLSRMENLPIADIAQRMNISPDTVENYLSQALKHLRSSLGEFLFLLVWLEMWE